MKQVKYDFLRLEAPRFRRSQILALAILLIGVVLVPHGTSAQQGGSVRDYDLGYSDWKGHLKAVENIHFDPTRDYHTGVLADYVFQLPNDEQLTAQFTIEIPRNQVYLYGPATEITYDLDKFQYVFQVSYYEYTLDDPHFFNGQPTYELYESIHEHFRRVGSFFTDGTLRKEGWGWDRWNTVKDVRDSIKTMAKYDSANQEVQVRPGFQEIYPALPFINAARDDWGQLNRNEPRAFADINYLPNQQYFARVFLFPGRGDSDYFNRPVIVSDAFDPFNTRHAKNILREAPFRNLLALKEGSPRYAGYDIYFIDFSQGAGDMLVNASLVLEFIEWMQTQTTSRVLLGGPSMSGIVARLALLYALPGNNTYECPQRYLAPNVAGYFSIDSPHQGASIDPTFQQAIFEIWGHFDRSCKDWSRQHPVYCDAVKSAHRQLLQLYTPATYQMLYGHIYQLGDYGLSKSSAGHDDFYRFLYQLGNYNGAMPRAAIAYSNFHEPHKGSWRWATRQPAGSIDIHIEVLTWEHNYSKGFDAGPPAEDRLHPGVHEFAPGSTGDFYYNLYKDRRVGGEERNGFYASNFVNPKVIEEEMYKGTFIPIYSALDLQASFFALDPLPADAETIARFSEFDAVYYMENKFNCYLKTNGACREAHNDKRYQHIIFDDQLMSAVMEAFAFLENPIYEPAAVDWQVTDDCVLQEEYQAPGNVVVYENKTLTVAQDAKLDIDFANHNLRIKPGGKVLIKPGGKIE